MSDPLTLAKIQVMSNEQFLKTWRIEADTTIDADDVCIASELKVSATLTVDGVIRLIG